MSKSSDRYFTGSLVEIANRSCIDEYTDHKIYEELSASRFVSREASRKLKEMSSHELRHYEFWRKYSSNCRPRLLRLKILFYKILLVLMGITFVVRFLEKHEKDVIESYKSILNSIPMEDRGTLEDIIKDEELHEDNLANSLNEVRIKYHSFVVLGLSDAIIEIAGIHAGTLGVYDNTIVAGLAGLIAGVAASIAMASAAYNQAKQDVNSGIRPGVSAVYTGIAYGIAAVLLALPYFIIHDIWFAFVASILISILMISYISAFASVVFDRSFKRELIETTLIILGASAILYFFGEVVGSFIGVKAI